MVPRSSFFAFDERNGVYQHGDVYQRLPLCDFFIFQDDNNNIKRKIIYYKRS